MFLTTAHFSDPPYKIPASQLVLPSFANMAEEKEAWALKRLLGLNLFAEFIAGVFESPYVAPGTVKTTIEQKWMDLRDGVKYLYGTSSYEWGGVVKLLRPLVYAYWLRANVDDYTDSGIVKPAVENATLASPHRRIADAYNDFSKQAGHLYSQEGTLYGFMHEKYSLSYPSWDYRDGAYGSYMGYVNPLFG